MLSAVDADGVPEALRTYEAARRPRVATAHVLSNANTTRLHLPEGPAQRTRDAEMAAASTGFSFPAIDWRWRSTRAAAWISLPGGLNPKEG